MNPRHVPAVIGQMALRLGIAVGPAIVVVPRVLDRVCHEEPERAHFDGARFVNPDARRAPARLIRVFPYRRAGLPRPPR